MIYENEVKKENKSLYLTMRLHISQTIHCYSTSISINLSLRMVTASAMSLTPRVFIHSAVRSTDIKSFPSTRYASKTRKEKLSGPGETCQNNVSESDTGPSPECPWFSGVPDISTWCFLIPFIPPTFLLFFPSFSSCRPFYLSKSSLSEVP